MVRFTNMQLAMIALLLDEEEEEENAIVYNEVFRKDDERLIELIEKKHKLKMKRLQMRKRKWVNEAIINRENEGKFAVLCRELLDDSTKFFHYFKMSEECFNSLLSKLSTNLRKRDTHLRKAITPKERLAVCLRYLTTGDSMKSISSSFQLGLSTVDVIIRDTCKVIKEDLMSEILPLPSLEVWESIANDFYTLKGFPNCGGALGAKVFTIQVSSKTDCVYIDSKREFSVILTSIVDAHGNFISIDVTNYDWEKKGGFFANTTLGKAFEENSLCLPKDHVLPGTSNKAPFVILGDKTFPLKTYLMRPFPPANLDKPQSIFNDRLNETRKVVDQAFNNLLNRFKLFNKRIHAKPVNVTHMILASCILHNFIEKYEGNTHELNPDLQINENKRKKLFDVLPYQGGTASRVALNTRELFKEYFQSENPPI